jgi:pimeloyl-ACP methyl ester carboxylesterase
MTKIDAISTRFVIDVPDRTIQDLWQRLARTRWPVGHSGGEWEFGASLPFLHEVHDHWQNRYDWRQNEARLNAFSHYKARIAPGRDIHYVVEKGSGTSPKPLLMIHGWPGSFVELLHLVEPLAHPERFGGSPEAGYTVIIPSLPGFGFSDPTPAPTTPAAIGKDLRNLMVEVLGFPRFLIHGGDWGTAIATQMGLHFPTLIEALHLTMVGGTPVLDSGPDLTVEELTWKRHDTEWRVKEGAYVLMQAAKPQSLSVGMTDSPMGLAAWILEKFHGWTCPAAKTIAPVPFTWDDLLTNLMIYWINGIATSNSLYTSVYDPQLLISYDRRVAIPTRVLAFPQDLAGPAPSTWADRVYADCSYAIAPTGGHFPGLEQPAMLAADIRTFFDSLKVNGR